jgi:hypothetical protein
VALRRPGSGGEDGVLSKGRLFLANFAIPGFVFQNRFSAIFPRAAKSPEKRGFCRKSSPSVNGR